jgi:hypothetical protein
MKIALACCVRSKRKQNEVPGNHRRQSQESSLEFGLRSVLGREARTIWIVDAHLGKLFATSPSPSNPLASLFVIAIDSVIGRLQMKANIVATT